MNTTNTLETWLLQFLADNGAAAGTAHLREGDVLVLHAAHNIPPAVSEKVRIVPKGKGMAGLAFENDAVIQTCNLKDDKSGNVRPGAKAVGAAAAAAIPVHRPNGEVRGVVGIAFLKDREIDTDVISMLSAQAEKAPF